MAVWRKEGDAMRARLSAWLDRSGFFVALAAGMAAVVLSAWLTGRLDLGGESASPAAVSTDETLQDTQTRANGAPVRPGELLRGFSLVEPVWFEAARAFLAHRACDYALPGDGVVRAVCAGEVVAVARDVLLGLCVSVRHEDGMVCRYAGLNSACVALGAVIAALDPIGEGGDGVLHERGEAAHVHITLFSGDQPVNPESLFDH